MSQSQNLTQLAFIHSHFLFIVVTVFVVCPVFLNKVSENVYWYVNIIKITSSAEINDLKIIYPSLKRLT